MRSLLAFLGLCLVFVLSGCSTGLTSISQNASVSPAVQGIQGVVHGGQQPVTGATITLWAVGSTGDGSLATSLTSTTTNGSGNFTLGTYSCTGDPDVYITASGGNPGLGSSNPNILMMAALTDCNTLKANAATTFIFVDEVTTVGSVAALYPYLTATGNLSYGSSDASAFATAFSTVAEYTNTSSGSAPGPNLPSGYYASSTEINTLGNIIASCINSTGGAAGDNSACGNLFNLTKSGSVAPTNTLGAMVNILNNPSQNVSSLFNLTQPITPFQPVDTVAPTSWALPILQMAATPTFSIPGGTYSGAQSVTLSDTTSGNVIHYTTDGSTPTSSSAIASGAITVSSSETINAIAQAGGYATSAVASATYVINAATTYSISGAIVLANGCGNALPTTTVTLTQGSTVIATTSTFSGAFVFSGVPSGTYTITPSLTGPSSEFYPASQSVVVNGSSVTGVVFDAAVGYTVSGTVAYGGSQTGQIYVALASTTCAGGGTEGTSISSKGAYTIRGVPPGSYTVEAFMDNQGKGDPNAANPSGSSTVTVSNSNRSGANVTMVDPTTVTLTAAPSIRGIGGFNNGVIGQYNPITNSSGVEMATSYTLQWSTTSNFTTIAGSQTFPAAGTHTDVWLLNSAVNPSLTNGSIYYFRAYGTSGGTATGPYSSVYGPVTIGPPAPSGGVTVSGSVSFTGSATGPLYTGFYDMNSGNFYGEYFPNPVSAQAYSVQVPIGSDYLFVGVLDQNNDGVIDVGDIENTNSDVVTAITGATSSENLTLPSANGTAVVTTSNIESINSSTTTKEYVLSYQVNGLLKLPVAVTLASGPNVISPIDIAVCGGTGSNCGRGFEIYFFINTNVPNVGDSYTFNVTYSDGTTGTLTATVTGVLNNFATNLAPQTGTSTSTTPTFSWTDPANASNYTYQFSLCCANSSDVWDIPGNNSNSNGFSSSITSITWGVDPTGGGSTPNVSSLTLGQSYSWQLEIQDSNGNTATTVVQYQP